MVDSNVNIDDDDIDDEEQENQYLTFGIAEEVYGVSILQVREIIRIVKITPIPESAECIKGIINLRGKIIPVMDVRLRFGIEEKELNDRTCIVVAQIQNVDIGLLVDNVSEVLSINDDQIENMATTISSKQRFVKGIGKIDDQIKIILDLDKLLFDVDMEEMKSLGDSEVSK